MQIPATQFESRCRLQRSFWVSWLLRVLDELRRSWLGDLLAGKLFKLCTFVVMTTG